MSEQLTDAELIEAVAIEVMGFEKPVKSFLVCYDATESFNPLTNANHWMMVVEKMKELRWTVTIDTYKDKDPTCQFKKMDVNQHFYEDWEEIGLSFWQRHKSIGHAVCLAALEAERSLKP